MSTSSSSFSHLFARLQGDLMPLSLLLWGSYMAILTVYCVIQQRIVSATPVDFTGTGFWILQNWFIWMLMTPLVFRGFRQYAQRAHKKIISGYLWLGGMALLAALLLRVVVDALTAYQGVASILITYTPKYLAALVVITLIWHFFLRPETRRDAAPSSSATSGCAKTLMVSKGKDKCLIQVDRIQFVSAASNYVEIYSDNQIYLLRATMKQVEEMLPAEQFLRVHRSYIVNLHDIDRIKTQAAGNGTLQLRCGRVLQISKAGQARLRQTG